MKKAVFNIITSGVPKGRMGGGSGPPTFQKVGPRDSHKNVIKLVGGGGGSGRSGRSVKKWSLRFLKSKQGMVFSRIGSKVLVSKKYLNTAGRGILSQSRMHSFKNFPGVLPPDPITSISLVMSV